MLRGTIKWFSEQKGYGFLVGEDNTDYFVHSRDVVGVTLAEGVTVQFEPEKTHKGLRAVNVAAVGEGR